MEVWKRKWQPTPVLLLGKFQGQRSLVGYSPQDRKESDMTERLHFTSQEKQGPEGICIEIKCKQSTCLFHLLFNLLESYSLCPPSSPASALVYLAACLKPQNHTLSSQTAFL